MKKFVLMLGAAAMLASGCTHSIQTTSGEAYLARYDDTAYAGADSRLDQEVKEIANIEPNLRFPARIGIARISDGELTLPGEGEMQSWAAMAERMGPKYGELVPVSPMIAAMVDTTPNTDKYRQTKTRQTQELVGDIRKAAARQHLDYILVYETYGKADDRENALAIADLTVIGMFIFPSRTIDIEGFSNAMLIDVRNGYPYGTASAMVEDKDVTRVINTYDTSLRGMKAAEVAAVDKLTGEVEQMMQGLFDEAALQAMNN